MSSARQLVAQMTAPAWQRFEHLVREHQKIKGQAVHVQTFMIECHARLSATCTGSRCERGHDHVYFADSWKLLVNLFQSTFS